MVFFTIEELTAHFRASDMPLPSLERYLVFEVSDKEKVRVRIYNEKGHDQKEKGASAAKWTPSDSVVEWWEETRKKFKNKTGHSHFMVGLQKGDRPSDMVKMTLTQIEERLREGAVTLRLMASTKGSS